MYVYMSYSLHPLKGGLYRESYGGLLQGSLSGMLGVQTVAYMLSHWNHGESNGQTEHEIDTLVIRCLI